MSEEQGTYSVEGQKVNVFTTETEASVGMVVVVPILRFVECDDAVTRIYANSYDLGYMEEEADCTFFVSLKFLGELMTPTIHGHYEYVKSWIIEEWEKFYEAIHTPEAGSESE